MARIKIGAQIKNYGDVTNLIIDLINRSNDFSPYFIIKLTKNYIEGYSLKVGENDINRLVFQVLEFMQNKEYVTYSNGTYKLISKDFTLDEFYKLYRIDSIML